jgi:photosystem II stability/assembly factor-like uncharacterized protein
MILRPVCVAPAARPKVRGWARRGGIALLAGLSVIVSGAAAPDMDQPLVRATHGLLVGIARAGTRLVAVGDRGHVLLSDDEGQHWRLVNSGTDELLTDVLFTGDKEGWAVGQDEIVLHSTDAGQTWATQHFTPKADQTLFSIAGIGPGHLIATGAYNLILHTQDSGATWKDDKIADLDDDYHLNCVVARGDDVLITAESGHAFLRASGAGAWAKMPVPYEGSQFGCLVGAGGMLYSFGLRGSLFKAASGATSWTRIDTGTQSSLFGGAVLPDGRLALVGGNGIVLVMDPATGKFTRIQSGTDQTLSAIVPTAGGKFAIAGDDGVHIIDPAASAASEETQ